MPRRKEPKREITISIGEEEMKDAFAKWVRQFHNIDINAKSIEFDVEDGKVLGMKAVKKPDINKSRSKIAPRITVEQQNEQ